jgi:hypothetical protein
MDMSQELNVELRSKTQQLLDGPLKHIRGAALAAALLPLASIAATPASAQTVASCNQYSGGACGIVFTDTNANGIFDTGDTPIAGITVYACTLCNGTDNLSVTTDLNGVFQFPAGTYTLMVMTPTGTQPSPLGPDNIGTSNGAGFSVSAMNGVLPGTASNNFGFVPAQIAQPGTGTPGYWKNHPEAWPVNSITVGGVTYTETQAISWLNKTGKDKTVTMFQSLVSAMLNVMIGNDASCINTSIAQGNAWLKAYPLGSDVAGGSQAWAIGDPIHITLDAYDNGLLCAPHRQ